jgi:hypothetical protein
MAIAVALLVAFAGCATTPIKMRNPQTGQVTQCGPYTNMHPFFPELSPHWKAERECINDYQRQGFERVPVPVDTK